jgi:hypothetical protein
MKLAGQEDTLTWVVLSIGVIMFLVLAYATVILWTGANPVPEIPTHISTGTTGEHTIRNNPGTVFLTFRPEDPAAPILRENFGGI